MKNNILLLFLSIYVFNYGQELPNIIPPSPNASSLVQYADVPVSNYTGVPYISVPLFDIKSGDLNLPISLSYHADGIKVAQEASWVGLGWALNAGGVITRQVRGVDDFYSYDLYDGYLRTDKFPPYTEDNNPNPSEYNQYENYYSHLKMGFLDGEQDIYYYNFLGFSGKIIFNKGYVSNDTIYGVSVEQNNLEFSYTKSTRTWVITDGNGTKYYFGPKGGREVTYNFSDSSIISFENINIDIPDNPANVQSQNISETAWYLARVESAKKDVINFFYKSPSHSVSQIRYSESLHKAMSYQQIYQGEPGYISPRGGVPYKLYSGSQQVTKDICIERIEFVDGELLFETEDRIDIDAHSSSENNPQRLKSITLKKLNENTSIKKVDFNYSYTGQGGSNKLRLKLDSIQESYNTDLGNKPNNPPYKFYYNNTALPEKTSFSIDYWGFFNDANNLYIDEYNSSVSLTSDHLNNRISYVQVSSNGIKSREKHLVPFYDNTYHGDEVFVEGANREANFNKAQAGVLTSIEDPLGGVTNFEYESNKYHSEEEELYHYISKTSVADKDNDDNFSLDRYTTVNISFDFGYDTGNSKPYDPNKLEVFLEKDDGNKLINVKPLAPENNNESVQVYFKVILPPGNYRLKTFYSDDDDDDDMTFSAKYNARITVVNKDGGGLRIKSIITTDNNNFVKKKTYTYEENGISTGRLVSPINHFYSENVVRSDNLISPGYNVESTDSTNYLVRKSNSITPLGNSAQGSPVGYDKVIVSYSDSNTNVLGKTEYNYRNEEEIPDKYLMPNIPNTLHLDNGQLLSKITYNTDGNIIDELFLTYSENEDSRENAKGVKFYISPFGHYGFYGVMTGTIISGIRFYDTFSKWYYLSKETKNTYDTNGKNPITTTKNYYYDNDKHLQPTRIETTNSKNDTLKTKTYYPDDVVSSNHLGLPHLDALEKKAIDSLKGDAQHIINIPIQVETYKNDVLISKQRNSFKQWNNQIIELEKVKTSKDNNPLEDRIIYHSYDDKGNPLEVSKVDGTHIVYVWGYHQTQPIAKIENATYTDLMRFKHQGGSDHLSPIYNASNNDNDRTLGYNGNEGKLREELEVFRTYFSNALVTTYTYDPLIGVTSITDPRGETIYYEYDEFNRLKHVKDQDGNILSKIEYNYKNY